MTLHEEETADLAAREYADVGGLVGDKRIAFLAGWRCCSAYMALLDGKSRNYLRTDDTKVPNLTD